MDNNQQNISTPLLIFNAAIVALIITMFFAIYEVLHKPVTNKLPSQAQSQRFTQLSLEAKAVYVFDVVKNRIIWKKNETAQLPLASLTKLMTALTAIELVPKNSRITVRKEFLEEEGDMGILSGETWKLKDLLDFSLMVSSNDGARSVASVVGALNLKIDDYDLGRKDFITKMNTRAKELGLEQTYFINESGLDLGSVSGGYGSAENMSKLLQYILINKPEILEVTKYKSWTIDSLTKKHMAENTNIAEKIHGLIASKTGYTQMAGGNLALAFDASIGRPIIVVVLGSTQEGRFRDVGLLVNATLEYIKE